MQKVFNNNMMAIVAVMLLIGFSAFKVAEEKVSGHFYRLDPLGNIDDDPMDEADANCNETSGVYCFVELKEEKPSNITTVEQANTNNLVENIYYYD